LSPERDLMAGAREADRPGATDETRSDEGDFAHGVLRAGEAWAKRAAEFILCALNLLTRQRDGDRASASNAALPQHRRDAGLGFASLCVGADRLADRGLA